MFSPPPQNIVLAADCRFAEQVLTAVKSVCCHNRRILFHLLNRDFPREWFAALNAALRPLDSEIRDVKIRNADIAAFVTYPHISDATYFRYFIPELLEADKLLYLDCDLVVNGRLQPVFDVDLDGLFAAAATDHIAETFHNTGRDYFNAGVLLVNNRLWREHDVCRRALALTGTGITPAEEGDQGVLNHLFAGRWRHLPRFCNYQVGIDFVFAASPDAPPREDLGGSLPLIVHYNTEAKPWLAGYGMVRFRELYWHYWRMDWAEIAAQRPQD